MSSSNGKRRLFEMDITYYGVTFMMHVCVIQYTIPYQFVTGLQLNILNLQVRQKWETNLLEMFLEKKCSISCSTYYGDTLQNPLYLQSTIYIPWPPPQHWPIRWETCHFKKHSRLVQKLGRGSKFWRFLKAEGHFPDIWIQGTLNRQVALIS